MPMMATCKWTVPVLQKLSPSENLRWSEMVYAVSFYFFFIASDLHFHQCLFNS